LLLIIHSSKRAVLFENVFIIFLEPYCFSTRRLRIKRHLSLVTPIVVTNLQFIRIRTELVYIGRRRTP